MTNSIIKYVEDHPWTIAAGIGGIIILYLVFSSGSSDSYAVQSVPVNASNTDQSLQIAQLQLHGQQQQLDAQLSATETQANRDVAIATLQQQLGVYQTSAGKDVSLAGIQSQSDIQLAGISAQHDVQLAGIQSQTQLADIAARTNVAQIGAARDLGIAQAATYAHMADVQAATTIASYQTTADIAKTQGTVQIKQGEYAYLTAQGYQKTAQHASDNSLIGGVIGGVLSLL